MIVVDGDSVAEDREDNWPALLGIAADLKVINLSRHQSTTKDVLRRIDYANSLSAKHYIVCLGQWSCRNEEFDSFKSGIERIIKKARNPLVLVTPPFATIEAHWTAKMMRKIAKRYRTTLVDFHARMQEDGADQSWFFREEIPCHLNTEGARRVVSYFAEVL